jgi:hypothetical protein
MRVDQCFCNRRDGGASILADHFVLGDISVAKIPAGCRQVTPRILHNLCCLAYVATASGWAEVDTWPLINGGWCHVTGGRAVRFVRLVLKVIV